MSSGKRELAETAIPKVAHDSVRQTLASIDGLTSNLQQFLSLADFDVLADLPPLHRARAFLVLAKAATTLFSVRLRCSGICPDDHPVSKEFERLRLYEEKLERFSEWSKAPLRPSTKLDYKAATRFIRYSLPDLTPEQRKGMQDISRGNHVRSWSLENLRQKKKRKHQTSEKQSTRAAAKEFLEKAARELLSSSYHGVKGPLADMSDDDKE